LRPAKIHFQLQRIQYLDFSGKKYPLSVLVGELNRNGIHLAQPGEPVQADRRPNLPGSRAAMVGIFAVLVVAALLGLPRLAPLLQGPTPTTIPYTIRQPNVERAGNIVLCVDGTGKPGQSLDVVVLDGSELVVLAPTSVSSRGHWKALLRIPPQAEVTGSIVLHPHNDTTITLATLSVQLGQQFLPGPSGLGAFVPETEDDCGSTGHKALD
jgi:hypothetical protein